MQVIVSFKIEVGASVSLSEMEGQIQEAGRGAMKKALKQAIRQQEEQQKECPTCGSEQFQTRGTKRRVLLTSFGRVEVPLRRQRCRACGHQFRPKDALFGRSERAQYHA